MKLYKPHPLALMFPAMNDAAIDVMADSIKTHGLQNPIVLYEDKVLDGVQRQEACKRVGVLPNYLQFILLSPAIVKAGPDVFVLNANLPRRHLKPDKYRDLVRKLLPRVEKQLEEQAEQDAETVSPTLEKRNKGRAGKAGSGIKDKAVEQIAKMTGKSKATVYGAIKDDTKRKQQRKQKPEKRTAETEAGWEIDGQPVSQVPLGNERTERWDVSKWAVECQLASLHVKVARAGLAQAREGAALKAQDKARKEKAREYE